MIVALTGFLAGAVHVLSGPDHLAAVAPLAAEARRPAWQTGLRWGLGHATGVCLVAFLMVALRGFLPVGEMSSWSERLVGLVLVGIGLWGFRSAMASRVHVHPHTHDGRPHAHLHVHGHTHRAAESEHRHLHAAFAVGTLHGLAGSAHLLGVLPALAMPTVAATVAYVGGFAAGTVAAMVAFASVVGGIARRQSVGAPRRYRLMLQTCSAAAVIIGGFWIVAA